MTTTRIPTDAETLTVIMGRVGKGPADRANLIGALVDRGFSFPHCDDKLDEILAEMVAAGRIERCDQPSQYVAGKTWAQWRLPASAPIDASAPRTGAGTVKDGFISASDFKKSGVRGRK